MFRILEKGTYMSNVRRAFTLAEVLITLGIIGVVAAMTLPSLIQKYKEKETVSRLKKFYSITSQAYNLALSNFGTPDTWNLLNYNESLGEENTNFLNYLKPYLNIIEYCGSEPNKCWSDTNTLTGSVFHHSSDKYYSKAILADGTAILTYVLDKTCTKTSGNIKEICGQMRVDINGQKFPNVLGRDVFSFYITKTKIIPTGTNLENSKNSSFEEGCIGENAEGRGCTAWVIYNENMDYLHCPEKIGWNKLNSCK